MKRILITALVLSMMAITSNAVRAETASHRDAAAFVEHAKIGQNLSAIAFSAARKTVTFTALASKVGDAAAVKAVSDEIGARLPLYQPKWDECIAQAYANTFTEEQLSSLASEGRSSKYAPDVVSRQGVIGKQMEMTAKPILVDLVSQALSAAMSKTP